MEQEQRKEVYELGYEDGKEWEYMKRPMINNRFNVVYHLL
jgi:hypothetical protein